MSILEVGERLTELEWAARMRQDDATLDKTYRKYPLGELVGRFMRAIASEDKAENTKLSYEPVLRLFVLYFRDYESLEPFTERGGLDLLYRFLEKHWRDAAPATRRQRGAILKSFFGWAEDDGYISRDPTRRLRTPKPPQPLRITHDLEQVRLIAASGNERDEAAVLLMARLGLRKSEVRQLQARDVDLAHDCIYVRRGKGGKPAVQPIEFEDVRDVLALWIPRDPQEYLLHPRHDRNRSLEASTMQRWWRGLLETAEVEPFPMHELRHTAIDHLWRTTGDLELVRQFARHESIRTTQMYLHPTEDDLRRAMRRSEGKQ